MFNKEEVMRFLDDEGKIRVYPSKRKKKIYVLEFLIEKFEMDRKYSEKEINKIIDNSHTFNDICLLRRELIDNKLLGRERDGSVYWRVNEKNNNEESERVNMEQIKKIYIEKLNEEINNLKENAEKLRAEGYDDEAKFEIIKANVVDIFSKIFVVSYNNVYVKVNNDNLKDIIESNITDKDKLVKCYERMLNTITNPWREKLEKDKEFGLVEKSIIEEIKIKESEKIENMFKRIING